MYTFTAGQKAKASEVNANFDELKVIEQLTADENINQYEAVAFVKSGVEIKPLQVDVNQNLDDGEQDITNPGGNQRVSQSFTIGDFNYLQDITIKLRANTSRTVSWALYNADANDEPTGSALKSGNFASGTGTNTFVLTINMNVNPGDKYCLVVYVSTGAGIYTDVWIRYQSSNPYSGGVAKYSTDSGNTWTDQTWDIYIVTQCKKFSTFGRIVKASAAANNYKANQFRGIALENISAGNSGRVQLAGVLQNTLWNFDSILDSDNEPLIYFDDNGLISTTPGTVVRKIGKAIATDKILLIPSFFT